MNVLNTKPVVIAAGQKFTVSHLSVTWGACSQGVWWRAQRVGSRDGQILSDEDVASGMLLGARKIGRYQLDVITAGFHLLLNAKGV